MQIGKKRLILRVIIARLVGQVGVANRGDVRGENLSVVNGDVIFKTGNIIQNFEELTQE